MNNLSDSHIIKFLYGLEFCEGLRFYLQDLTNNFLEFSSIKQYRVAQLATNIIA